jgi:peptidoglycan/xylan/chitin deacetylase (PgdA/CDA1 family)
MMDDMYVLFGFDVEHDAEPFSATCEGVKKGIPLILDILDTYDIHCTFNILANIIDDNFDLFKQIHKSGHELGCHSYDHEALSFMSDEEIYSQIEKATHDIHKKLGKRPVTFRAPYLLGNTFLINTLDEFHYLVDSSYPLAHYKKQVLPYHPSASNWIKKGNLPLLELPVSADPFIKAPEKSDIWPLWRIRGAKDTKDKIENLIKKQNEYKKKNVITFYLHPWEFIELEKIGIDVPDDHQEKIYSGNGEKAISNFKEIIHWLKKQKNATFLTMKEFRPIWEELV